MKSTAFRVQFKSVISFKHLKEINLLMDAEFQGKQSTFFNEGIFSNASKLFLKVQVISDFDPF